MSRLLLSNPAELKEKYGCPPWVLVRTPSLVEVVSVPPIALVGDLENGEAAGPERSVSRCEL
jgi:hypothetical protein